MDFNKNEFNITLKDYKLKFYFKPALFLNNSEIENLKQDMFYVKNNCNPNINYGIFSKKNNLDECLKNVLISIFYLNEEPVGMFYNVIINIPSLQKTASHQGLFILNKNSGIDILNSVGVISSIILFEKIGEFYVTTLSSTPSVLESIIENTSDAWPCYYSNNQRPPVDYKEVFKITVNEYKDKFISENEIIDIDYKKFKIKISNSVSNYSLGIHNFPLAKKTEHNLFYNFWINYNLEELVFLICKYNLQNQIDNKNKLLKYFNVSF